MSVGTVYLPGQTVVDLEKSESSGKTVIGPGLRRTTDNILATKPGVLRFREPNIYWLDCHQKRYVPVRGDHILGIVIGKAGDIFKVDVGSSEYASLPYVAFEGATKRNRPDVKIGDLVYAKFVAANKDMEAELVCIDGTGKCNGMGIIRDEGFMFRTSLNHIKKILSPTCVLLKTMGKSLPYEIAVGMNGRIWIKGRSTSETIAILNAISSSEYMNNDQIKIMLNQLVDALAGFV